ncbi:glycosyltransferase family 4 protein [Sphingobacterium sp. SGR-19]|uniref:glycosyltransferase family 4 protein n=1 Tax=Sphingobacterium sp. SGR-19 TaxID=2710886 RepID=UPI0013EAD958|nr:glycosyltransferase family 4 protein [Sphingobacterium sp. SGR-19]NGM67217.1 glycosyltransferase family 4 protein [Sphingobacterium sp. SGR-19]
MKVLYYHQYFTTPSNGGGTRSYEFAQALIANGHQVTVVCGGADDKFNLPIVSKYISRGEVDGIDVIQVRVNTQNTDSISKRAVDFLSYGIIGVRLALKEKYDLLFATSTPLTAAIPGIVMKLFRKKNKFVFEVRDLWPELPKALGMKNPLLLGGMSILEKYGYKSADACIGLSPGICKGIKKRSSEGKLIKMIPNGCDLELFRRDEKIASSFSVSGINPSDVVAVFTGAHGVANGIDALLDTAAELKKRNTGNIKFLFVGSGKEKQRLIERAKKQQLDNCIFLNRMSKYELNTVMNRADIGLMVLQNVPAFYYGTSPNKFFDYLSAGLPIVNNYPGWLADIIGESKCGMVVRPEDAEEFASTLIYLANNPELRRKMGENARQLAEKKFSRNDLANKFVAFLEGVNEK